MTPSTSSPPADPSPAAPRFLPVLLLLFFGSGCAALIYEIVWFQLLGFVIGSSAVSLAVLLGTFMGGMCLGSLLLPRLVSPRHHPLRVYALLEFGIAAAALFVLFALPSIARAYTSLATTGLTGLLWRGLVCALCLLPPTMLMGATLPAIARWVEATPRGVSWLGGFYGGNTLGAVAGSLLAGFYLLRVYDLPTATACAVVLNVLVAVLALVLARLSPAIPLSVAPPPSVVPSLPRRSLPVLTAIALSGLCALSAEVIWTRQLSLLLGATVYTFSLILAVFLTGLGIGSAAGAMIARDSARPRFALGVCQLLLVAAIAWSAYALAHSLPFWPVTANATTTPWIKFQIDLVRCAWAILPAACLWGASFPLALAALATPGSDSGRLVGLTYAANTVGAIVGALVTSLGLIPALGTQAISRLLLTLALLAAALAFAPRRSAGWSAFAACTAVAGMLAFTIAPLPWQLVAYGRQIATSDATAEVLFLGEGINASVAVTQSSAGARFFHVSGKTEASSLYQDMRLQRMLGHLPALLHAEPKSVLIVGCGAGVTAGSFVAYPSITRIVICEIEPLIPRTIATRFGTENHQVVRDPRVEIIYDDARHYLATTREKFDIITSDPIHPWVKGAAVLYTQEYFNLCRDHLNPGGLVTQWVPLYESSRAVVQSEIATFFSVFPHGTIWGNDDEGYGYDTVMLGTRDAFTINLDEAQTRLDRPDHALAGQALAELGFVTANSLLSTYAGRAGDFTAWLREAEINRDRSLRLQYLAGLGLNSSRGAESYADMLRLVRFPEDLFTGSAERRESLRRALFPSAEKNP